MRGSVPLSPSQSSRLAMTAAQHAPDRAGFTAAVITGTHYFYENEVVLRGTYVDALIR